MSADYTTTARHETFELLQNRKVDIAFLQETHSKPDVARKWEKEWPGKSLRHCTLDQLLKHQEIYGEVKIHETFELLQNRKVDIAFLQETHSKPDVAQKWEKEWPGKSLWHSGPTSKASGVAILLRENSNIDIISSYRDQNGSILKTMLQFEEDIFQIINIYAPTNTSVRKTFYNTLPNIIEKNKNTILARDINMIENIFLDRLGGNPKNSHKIGIQTLHKIKNNHNLEDIWRRKKSIYKTFHIS